jgi:uncharacterized membrane protein YraQ (UPF0718 family)/copper chaperone CopZ
MKLLFEFFSEVWATAEAMAPYLLFGFALAGLLSQLVTEETVERHLGKAGFWSTLKASLLGVPLPLCSCGVIPVAASLRSHGASRGATTGFLISTPQTGVDSVLATYGMLGPVVAVFRVVAAFVSGLIGGVLVDAFGGPAPPSGLLKAKADGCSDSHVERGFLPALRYGFITLPASIGNALIVGMLIAGALGALLPDGSIPVWLGSGIVGMLAMLALGVPMYVCATSSIPVAAAMVAKGMSPGAALVFLMTGPATNAATIGVLWRALGRRAAVLYVAVVAASALASGFLLDAFFAGSMLESGAHGGRHLLPPWAGTVSAVILFTLILLPRFWKGGHASCSVDDGETAMELAVDGMTCQHCAESARKAGMACSGVSSVEVDLRGGRVRVVGPDLREQELCAAFEAAGFRAKALERG